MHKEKTMKKKLVIFAIAFSLTTTAAAESDHPFSEPTHQIGIVLGGVHYQVRDDIVAPLCWDGFGPVGGLSYTFVGDDGRHDIELRIPFAFLWYDHKAVVLEVNLGYGCTGSPAANRRDSSTWAVCSIGA